MSGPLKQEVVVVDVEDDVDVEDIVGIAICVITGSANCPDVYFVDDQGTMVKSTATLLELTVVGSGEYEILVRVPGNFEITKTTTSFKFLWRETDKLVEEIKLCEHWD